MAYSNFEGPAKIPNITTRKSAPMTTNFAKGIYTYKPNDTMDVDEIRLAENARFDRVGEYATRSGMAQFYEPSSNVRANYIFAAGNATLVSNWSNSPVASEYSQIDRFNFVAENSAGLVYMIDIMPAKKTATSSGIIKVNLVVDGVTQASAYLNSDEITGTGADQIGPDYSVPVYLNDPVFVDQGQRVEVTLEAYRGNLGDFLFGSSGGTLICSVKRGYSGGVGNIFEANISGIKVVLFTQGNALYYLTKDEESATKITFYSTKIRDLPAGVTKVRFSQNLNKIRYADGKEGPRLLTPTITAGAITGWTDNAISTTDLKTGTNLNISVNNIMNGTADNLVYGVVDPDTEAVWTYPYGYTYAKAPAFTTTATISGAVGTTLSVNVSTISPSGIAVGDWITGQGTGTAAVTSISGSTVYLKIVDTTPQTISSYDKFSSDFYQNFPAIKTGDPLTAMFNLGGVLYFMTRRNKYQMYAQTAETWSQSASNAQNGTFSQESLVCDLNYAYYANDKGIYIFDGSSEASLTEKSIQNVYDAIPNKESICIDLYDNRLYVFYSDDGTVNNHCLIYNINLHVWESFDSNTFVSATSGRQNSSNRLLCGHSKIGLIMVAEQGNYSDLGSPIAFNLETSYLHFGTTSQLKRITKWRPEFAATTQPYTIECGYSLDFDDQVHYAFSIDLQKQIPTVLDYVWDNPSDYGIPTKPTVHTTIPRVNGEFYRCQVRYQHIAAFEPVIFRSHTLTVQTQRIR